MCFVQAWPSSLYSTAAIIQSKEIIKPQIVTHHQTIVCLHWHHWQCADDEIPVLYGLKTIVLSYYFIVQKPSLFGDVSKSCWVYWSSWHISFLTLYSIICFLPSWFSCWQYMIIFKTAPPINSVALIKAGKEHSTQWLKVIKTALSLPTKQHCSQQHSHHFCWRREERCRSGLAWKSAVWNQTFSSAEAGVNSTMCANICAHHFGNPKPCQIRSSVSVGFARICSSSPYNVNGHLKEWTRCSSSVISGCLSLWGRRVFAQVLCWTITSPSSCSMASQMGQWEVKTVHQVGYLWSCWKVRDVPLEWCLGRGETEIKEEGD